MHQKKTDSILGICFIITLAIVFILNIVIPDKSFSEEENRILQKKPEFSFSSYAEGRYEKKLEDYSNDQFILRNVFIKIKTASDLTLGKVKSNGVYKGKDGYLIEEIQKPNREYMESTIKGLSEFKETYPSMNMYFLMAPNAGNILKDKLPAGVRLINQKKAINKFYDSISNLGYVTIDVQDVMTKHKDDLQLYYHTDHHWTTDGAYLAYKQAASTMNLTDPIDYKPYVVKNDFRGTLASKSGFVNGQNDAIKIYLPEDENYKNSVIYYGDTKKKTTRFYQLENLEEKDAYTVFGGSNHPIYSIKTPVNTQRKLLLFKDSYANSMIPFLSQNYREIVVIDPRYYFGNIHDIISSVGITDALFLYNANTFFGDNSLSTMLNIKNSQ